MRFGAVCLAALAYLSAGNASYAQTQAQPQVEFHFEDPRLQPAKYTIELDEDGTGRFHADPGASQPDDIAALPPQGQDRPIQVSTPITHRIFAIAKQKHFFAIPCDAGGDTVAFQGKKTLSYRGPAGQGSCSYNYSKDPQIEWVTAELESIASTLEAGRKLQLEYDHAKLALDAELETLASLVHENQATELGNIAPILRIIASDDTVMQRAQRRARALLAVGEAAQNGK